MSSSVVAKSLQLRSYKGSNPSSNSPSKMISSSTASSSKNDEPQASAPKRSPPTKIESISRYGIGSSSRYSFGKSFKRSGAIRKQELASQIGVPSRQPDNGLPTRKLSGVIISPNRRTSSGAASANKSDDNLPSFPFRRTSVTRPDFAMSPLRRLSSERKSIEGTSSSAPGADENARFQESPYLGRGSFERTQNTVPSKRRSSLRDHLQHLSEATPELSPSPLVSTLSSSPIVDLLTTDASARRMSSNLPDPKDSTTSRRGVTSPERRDSNANASASVETVPEDKKQFAGWAASMETKSECTGECAHTNKVSDVPGEFGREQPSFADNPSTPLVSHSAFQSSGGGVELVTNPLYPKMSSPESFLSPLATVPRDVGANHVTTTHESKREFLQKRKAAAAQQRQKLPGMGTGDPYSAASQAIVKRRLQVLSTVEKAKSRLSQLSNETVRRRKFFGKGLCGRLQKFIFVREQRRLKGKGIRLMRLWVDSLRAMENSYGSSMMLAFSFIRWVFLLNSVLAVLWTVVIVFPFMLYPPSTFSWSRFFRSISDKSEIKNTLQGEELDKSFVYYGGYTYQRHEQEGWYRVDYMYPVLIGATFLISFLGALGRIAGRIMSTGDIAMAARLYPFSALVFASWDFHITSLEAANKLRRGVRMQLKEMLADNKVKMPKAGLRDRLMSAKRFTALFLLWPVTMGLMVFAVIQLVTKADLINEKLGSQYAQAVLFSVLNIIMPMIVRILVDMEDFKPATAERVVLTKLFCLRILNLATLFYRLFMMLNHTLAVRTGEVAVETCDSQSTCAEGFTCCTKINMTDWNICTEQDINFCLPACTENVIGAQLLRLIVTTTFVNGAYELIYGLGYVWTKSGNKRQLYIEDMAIDVVYVQALVWVGSCFSPVATVLGFFSNLVTWYAYRLALFRTCAPVEKAYSASRTSTLTYGLLLITLILSTIPATISVMQRNSGFCGPIHQQISMYSVLTAYVQQAPSALWITLSWLTNPAVMLGVIFFLIFVVVLVQSKLVQTRQFLALTKFEIGTQRKESNEKLKRVRQTLMHSGIGGSSIVPRLSPSWASGSSFDQSPSSTPTLPGQVETHSAPVEAFRFPMFVCSEHEPCPFLTYACKAPKLGGDKVASTQTGTSPDFKTGQSLPRPSALQNLPSCDTIGPQVKTGQKDEIFSPDLSQRTPSPGLDQKTPASDLNQWTPAPDLNRRANTPFPQLSQRISSPDLNLKTSVSDFRYRAPPDLNQRTFSLDLKQLSISSDTGDSPQLLDTMPTQTLQNQRIPAEDHQVLSPPIIYSKEVSMPVEGPQSAEAPDRLSLSQARRRLSQTQQQEIEQPKLVGAQPPQSKAQVRHSLGQILRRLSQTKDGVEQPKLDPVAIMASQIRRSDEKNESSPDAQIPICATEILVSSESSRIGGSSGTASLDIQSPILATQIPGHSESSPDLDRRISSFQGKPQSIIDKGDSPQIRGPVPIQTLQTQWAKSEDQQVLSPPINYSKEIKMPVEGNQSAEAQNWLSLTQILKRLSQDQQQEMEQPQLVNAQRQSVAQDWHSLGQILKRLSHTQDDVEQPNSDPRITEAPQFRRSDERSEISPNAQTPIFATEIPVQSESSTPSAASLGSSSVNTRSLIFATEIPGSSRMSSLEIQTPVLASEVSRPLDTAAVVVPPMTAPIEELKDEQSLPQHKLELKPSRRSEPLMELTRDSILRRLRKRPEKDQQSSSPPQPQGSQSQETPSRTRRKSKVTAPSHGTILSLWR